MTTQRYLMLIGAVVLAAGIGVGANLAVIDGNLANTLIGTILGAVAGIGGATAVRK